MACSNPKIMCEQSDFKKQLFEVFVQRVKAYIREKNLQSLIDRGGKN